MSKPSLNTQILIATIAGLLFGWLASLASLPIQENSLYAAGLVGTLFIDLLKMILIPLVFCSITVGIANLRQHQQMNRVWISTLAFFFTSMAIAMVLALLVGHYFKPGAGLHMAMFEQALQNYTAKQMTVSAFFAQFLHGLFVNPFKALAEGNILAAVIFALFLGVALVLGGERYAYVRQLMQEMLEIVMRMVSWVMVLAPLGIAALLFKLAATQDMAMLQSLASFVAVVLGTLLFHGAVILPLILYAFTKHSPLWFWRGSRDALLTAFATSSSAATLPVTLRCVTQNLQVKPEIGGFVVPLGATVNMDGTALYEAAAALFVANLVGIELDWVHQLIVFFTAMLAAIGAPGIPSAGMVTMVMVLQSVGLPAEAIAILLPIDRFIDTLRTAVNVEGDMVGSLVVQKLVD